MSEKRLLNVLTKVKENGFSLKMETMQDGGLLYIVDAVVRNGYIQSMESTRKYFRTLVGLEEFLVVNSFDSSIVKEENETEPIHENQIESSSHCTKTDHQ